MKLRIIISVFLLWSIFPHFINIESSAEFSGQEISIAVDQIIADGFNAPVQVTHAGDGSGRLFVVEQNGRIQIIHENFATSQFLDIQSKVSTGSERGLLGLAFHPNFDLNGYFFVDYTNTDGDTVISRFQISGDPNVADPDSEVILLTVNQPYSNHNGGQVIFGPDGYLYITLGDGGSAGDPQNNAQDLSTPLGKILRIDVDQGNPYSIPPDNPFIDRSDADNRIWAWGLRNPWRISFDRLTGDLYIGDVGQNQWEEIDYQSSDSQGGINYGWRCYEGTHIYNTADPCDSSVYLDTLTPPISEYSHSEGQSVTGGFVYRGSDFPNFNGVYFFADYVTGKIFSLHRNGNDWTRSLELDTGFLISSFGEDENGELYVVDYGGTIRRLTDPTVSSGDLESSNITVDKKQADPGEVLTYTIQIINEGVSLSDPVTMTNQIPEKISYIEGTMSADRGTIDDSNPAFLEWNGIAPTNGTVTITYQAEIKSEADGSIINFIQINNPQIQEIIRHSVTSTPRPVFNSTPNDFFLPGTQPGLGDDLIDSADCNICHSSPVFDQWRGSAMSQAGRDPLTWAAIFNANAYVPDSGEYCLRCHTPNGWYNNRSSPADGSGLVPQDIRNGIGCQFCHRMVDPVPSSDETSTIDQSIRENIVILPPQENRGSAMILLDPLDRRRGPFDLADDFPYHTAYQTNFLGQSQNAWKESSLCGSCHNVDNPLLTWDEGRQQYWPNDMDTEAPGFGDGDLFPIETTFDEWAVSAYAEGGVYAPNFAGELPGKTVRSCQDCHMPRISGFAADEEFNPVFRDCQETGCLPEHSFLGANTWLPEILQDPSWRLSSETDNAYLDHTRQRTTQFLRKAASLTIELTENGTGKTAQVTITNETGHKLPTGYPEGRRMWIHLQAFNNNGELIYESGEYDWTNHDLVLDDDIKIYEAKQGISPELASLTGLPEGPSFHFILNNIVEKDNRIPPRGVTREEFDVFGLRPVGATYASNQYWDTTEYNVPGETESVTVRLYYQVASKEYIDFLINNGGYDGYLLDEIWQNNPSDPVIMQTAFSPGYISILPIIFK